MEEVYAEEETPPMESAEAAPEEGAPESIDEQEASSPTAVIDNKVLSPGGEPLKEGDRIIVTIVKNYGDESEIRYGKAEAGEEVQSPGMMEEANAELDTMDEG